MFTCLFFSGCTAEKTFRVTGVSYDQAYEICMNVFRINQFYISYESQDSGIITGSKSGPMVAQTNYNPYLGWQTVAGQIIVEISVQIVKDGFNSNIVKIDCNVNQQNMASQAFANNSVDTFISSLERSGAIVQKL